MSVTQLEMANKALLKLGQTPITNLDEDTPTARAVKLAYGSVLDYELSIYHWVFAVKRVALPKDQDKPAFGYNNAYSLPADFLRLVGLEDLPPQARDAYALEGNKILTNLEPPLKLTYITRDIGALSLPPYFVEVFTTRLAYELCEILKQDPQRKNTLLQEYQLGIRNAKRANAIQMPVLALQPTPWEGAHGF